MYRSRVLISIVSLLMTLPVAARTQNTEHTYKLDDPNVRPPATLADVAWLVGSWAGPAFGGTAEEVWNPPSAGSMVGMFKLIHGEEVSFYELLLIVEEERTLNLKVKHFNSDLSAWEDKEDYINFRFIGVDEDAIHFSGVSFYRISADEIHVYLALHKDKAVREQKLVYLRTGTSPVFPPKLELP